MPTIKYQKQKLGENSICYSNKKNRVYRDKPNQGGKRPVLRKLQHWRKKLSKTQLNGNIHPVHGLKKLTSSKCPYYPKQFIDSTQSLLKY